MIPISDMGHTYMCAHCCAECRLVRLHWFQDFLGTTPLMRCLATLVGLVIEILKYGDSPDSAGIWRAAMQRHFHQHEKQKGLHKCLKLDPFALWSDPTLRDVFC